MFDVISVPMRFVDSISLSKVGCAVQNDADLESPCSVQVTRTSTKFVCATSDNVTYIYVSMYIYVAICLLFT